MTRAEQFEAAMKLAEFGADRHNGRREYEWKVTLGLWAVILTGIATLRGEILPGWAGWVTILLYAFLWLRGVWVANERDKQLSVHYRGQAESLLTTTNHELKRAATYVPWYWWAFGFLRDWSMLFQLLTTVALVRLAYLLIK